MTTRTLTIIILTTRVPTIQVGKSLMSCYRGPGFVPALILIFSLVSIHPSSQKYYHSHDTSTKTSGKE